MTDKETARLQGYDTRRLKLDPKISNNYFLIGNSMSVPVLERLWIATQRAQGFSADDPWANGVRQAQLVEAAQQDRLTPSHIQKLRASATHVQSVIDAAKPQAKNTILGLLLKRPHEIGEAADSPSQPPPAGTPSLKKPRATTPIKAAAGDSHSLSKYFSASRLHTKTKHPQVDVQDTHQAWSAARKSKFAKATPDPHLESKTLAHQVIPKDSSSRSPRKQRCKQGGSSLGSRLKRTTSSKEQKDSNSGFDRARRDTNDKALPLTAQDDDDHQLAPLNKRPRGTMYIKPQPPHIGEGGNRGKRPAHPTPDETESKKNRLPRDDHNDPPPSPNG